MYVSVFGKGLLIGWLVGWISRHKHARMHARARLPNAFCCALSNSSHNQNHHSNITSTPTSPPQNNHKSKTVAIAGLEGSGWICLTTPDAVLAQATPLCFVSFGIVLVVRLSSPFTSPDPRLTVLLSYYFWIVSHLLPRHPTDCPTVLFFWLL